MATPQDRSSTRPAELLALLAIVVMFEGFDVNVTSVVLPYAGRAFGMDAAALGRTLSVIGLGAIAAWLVIRLADRWGRRPVLILAAAGFSLGSLATAFAPNAATFTAIQFVTRLLLVTQIALAYLILAESLAPHMRGRAAGVLGACGSFGAALPLLLLEPALGTALGWRALYVVGAAPLLMLPLLVWRLRETPLFLARASAPSPKWGSDLQLLTSAPHRGAFAAMSALWFVINFSSGVGTFFFSFYVLGERGWEAADLAMIAPAGLASAFLGYLAAGWLMDRVGRKPTAMAFFAASGVLVIICYLARDWWVIAACWVALQAMLGIWTVGFTINSELFPTNVRAAANGWCNNLLGRWGLVLAPLLQGALAAALGSIGDATVVLGFVTFLGLPLIWWGLPETRGRSLAGIAKPEPTKRQGESAWT